MMRSFCILCLLLLVPAIALAQAKTSSDCLHQMPFKRRSNGFQMLNNTRPNHKIIGLIDISSLKMSIRPKVDSLFLRL